MGAVPGDTFFGAGGNLTYDGLTALTLNAGSAGDTINVQNTATGIATTINSGGSSGVTDGSAA